jgi:hypothetical protein
MFGRGTKYQRLIAVFLFGCLLFTFPLLSLFNSSQLVFGIPMMYLYVFGAWALLIGLMVVVTVRSR